MKKKVLCLLLFPIGCLMLSCNTEKTLAPSVLLELEDVERDMFNAIANGDSAVFRKLCGSEYYTINANGEGHTLRETLPAVPRFKGFKNLLSEQQQRVFGNFVMRNGRLKVYSGDKQVAEILFTTGWIYRDSRWQFVHWQGTMTGMMLTPLRGNGMIEPPAVQ